MVHKDQRDKVKSSSQTSVRDESNKYLQHGGSTGSHQGACRLKEGGVEAARRWGRPGRWPGLNRTPRGAKEI